MKTFSSLAAVMALWLAVSFLLWAFYRLFRHRGGAKQMQLVSGALGLIDEGAAIFAGLRTRASERVTAQGNYRAASGGTAEILREDVRSLLNGIEAQSVYFERVNVNKKKLQQTFDMPDFLALSEILQIRRDFWAASEVFLMEGIQELGPELADQRSFEAFQAEARALLFKEAAGDPGSRDPVELRLAIAREDALAFQAEIMRAIAAEQERSRFPAPGELIAVPWSLVKGAAAGLREVRYLLGDAAVAAQALARAMTSKGLKGAAEELRQARRDMPGQFATAFERAGGLARQGGQSLKRHYEFVLEAQELRARYAELLARAPDLSEKGKQFLARLELERRAEQFRETSASLSDLARQKLVAAIAYLIASLQIVQAKITPAGHKQLAPLATGAGSAAAPPPPVSEPEKPLRVLLLPASSYSGGNYGQGTGPASRRRRGRPESPDSRPKATADEAILAGAPHEGEVRLRDLLTGAASAIPVEPSRKPAPQKKPRKPAKPRVSYEDGLKKMAFKDLLASSANEPEEGLAERAGPAAIAEDTQRERTRRGGGSLLDRLSSIEPRPEPQQQTPPTEMKAEITAHSAPQKEKPEAKGWRLFGSRRK